MKNLVMLFALGLSFDSFAGVYKCTDPSGHTFYQSSPCVDEHKSIQINPKTGSVVDLTAQEQQQALGAEERKRAEAQQKAEEASRLEALAQRKKLAKVESDLTQAMIKKNPLQFSAYAIPPYEPEKLPENVKPYESRLVEIEKFRRIAAQKALASGKCQRVEDDGLHSSSKSDLLVVLVSCSSGASFQYNENELKIK